MRTQIEKNQIRIGFLNATHIKKKIKWKVFKTLDSVALDFPEQVLTLVNITLSTENRNAYTSLIQDLSLHTTL